MKRSVNLISAACAGFLIPGCQATLEQAVQETPAEVPAQCVGLMVSQEEAIRMMSACEVESLGQPHEGPVVLYRPDGSKQCFIQPKLDWVLIYARTACMEKPIRLYIE